MKRVEILAGHFAGDDVVILPTATALHFEIALSARHAEFILPKQHAFDVADVAQPPALHTNPTKAQVKPKHTACRTLRGAFRAWHCAVQHCSSSVFGTL